METVVIVGGGASGMMAALSAAESGNKRIVLIERQQRLGRKLAATGNGRCNLTNINASAGNYHGEQEDFALSVLARFTPEDTLRFFRSLGLVTVTEYGGRVYPLSNSANSVVDVLRYALERAGVELRLGECVRELRKEKAGYSVLTDKGQLHADWLIIACGGAAGEKLGGVMDGYELLKPLGHKRTKLYPALVQLICDSAYPKALKGVRADGRVSLFSGETLLAAGEGEIQFTDNGVSGPAVFDISRAASVNGPGLELRLDFMRGYEKDKVTALLKERRAFLPGLPAAEIFTGILHNRLGRMAAKYAALPATLPLGELDDAAIERASEAVKCFSMKLSGTEGFDSAQVTAGGIKTGGIDPETLQSWFMPGLFICGELLDVDADCGGYNLQWAWASGYVAGRLGE